NAARQQRLARAVARLGRAWCGTGPADGARMCHAMVHRTAAMMVSRDTKRRRGGDFPRIAAASAQAAASPPAATGAPNPAESVPRWFRRAAAAAGSRAQAAPGVGSGGSAALAVALGDHAARHHVAAARAVAVGELVALGREDAEPLPVGAARRQDVGIDIAVAAVGDLGGVAALRIILRRLLARGLGLAPLARAVAGGQREQQHQASDPQHGAIPSMRRRGEASPEPLYGRLTANPRVTAAGAAVALPQRRAPPGQNRPRSKSASASRSCCVVFMTKGP